MSDEFLKGPVERIRRLAFSVVGKPITQGSKKAYKVGNFVRIVDANEEALQDWRASVVAAARIAMDGRDGFERQTPVAVLTTFYLKRPTTIKRLWPTVPPDVEKLSRAMLDAMTIAGVYGDDSQVVRATSEKKYADRDHPIGAEVLVVELA
ncbi:RusA family crossover junction endodeoxyribonuclease [Gryllotalpicola koreensis]|uniref:Uncharacterized protein n=1 Tax=Gryllotalpicola koreensis TaxID=993086 RepID=A0ABP8A245_9MICO